MNNRNIKPISPFILYCQKVIPLAYDESMSYYECLCALTNYLYNEVIPAVNNNADAVTELQNAFINLKSYVDNYFENLDVQEEINNKLDEMAGDGTLAEIIGEYYAKACLITENIETLKDMDVIENAIIKVLNKNDGDNLSAYFKVVNASYSDESKEIIPLNNGLKAIKLNLLNNINEIETHFIYRGQNMGDCILLKGTKNVLIDVGVETGINNLITYLINNNVTKIDYLIITHVHSDHIANLDGLIQLLQNANIDFSRCKFILNTPIDWTSFQGDTSLINSYQTRETSITNMGNLLGGVIYPDNTTKIYLDSDNYLKFYNTTYPSSYYSTLTSDNNTDLNNFSLVTELIHHDKRLLFSADIDTVSENNIINDIDKVDVLKVMHHGVNPNDSINFINKINPSYSIIMNTAPTRYQAFYTLIRRLKSILYTSNESENIIIKTNQNELNITSTNGYLNDNMGYNLQYGDNLNDCKLEGTYRVATGSGIDNGIVNSPVENTINFVMNVEIISTTSTDVRVYQTLKTNSMHPQIYVRVYSGGGWSSWELMNDTGWTQLQLANGFTGNIQYRKYGNVVQIVGSVNGVINSAYFSLLADDITIPSGYRVGQQQWTVGRLGDNTMHFIFFDNTGTIRVLENLGASSVSLRFSHTYLLQR